MGKEFKYVENNVVMNRQYDEQIGIDFIPNQIKIVDFTNLNYGEKKCLYALSVVAFDYSNNYTFKNYEEGKISLFKDGDIWQVYAVLDGKAYYPTCFLNLYEACEELLKNMMIDELLISFNNIVQSRIDEDVINKYIEELTEKYQERQKNKSL